ncbi:MAG: hypothetical protein P1U39_04135 [Legionellaceae bacterium]|nr:hypothetical protein [Legionellaceae bacterium]
MPISREILERLQANDITLTKLNLVNKEISNEDVEHLAAALKENTTLTSLNLRNNQIGAEGVEHLAAALKENTTLTSLDLELNFISAEGAEHLAAALKENTTLTSLNLGNNQIGAEGAEHLAAALKKNTTLTSLDLGNCAYHLGNNQIGAEGAEHLAAALKENTTLKSLNLGDNQIDAEGAEYLAAALKENTTLTSLNLGNNQIDAEGAEYLAAALKENTTLTSLDLGNNRIGAAGAAHLGAALKENTTLTSLNLERNLIRDEGTAHLAAALKENTTLTSLNLERNLIRDEGAKYLAAALKENTTLTSLNLLGDYELMHAEGISGLLRASGMSTQASIDHLELNQIGAAGAEHLAAALKENYTLLKLDRKLSRKLEALISRNAHIADGLKLLNDFTTSALLNFEMINEAIETLSTLVRELNSEGNPLPEDSYPSEIHRLLCALSYLQRGYLARVIVLLESPLRHPQLAIIADKMYAEALMVYEAPEDTTMQVARYKLLAYCGRHDINSAEFATGLAGVSLSQDEHPDVGFIHSVLSNPRNLPNGAYWLSYDELQGLAQSAFGQAALDSAERRLLEAVIVQKDYHPVTVNNCFHSPLFIQALRTAYPHQDTFQCLEGYLDLQHIDDLGALYVLPTEVDETDLTIVIPDVDNAHKPYACVQDEITGLKQSITQALELPNTIYLAEFKSIVDGYKSTSLLGDVGKQLSTLWFLSWMISPTRSNTMLALQTLLKESKENHMHDISKEDIHQAIEQSESGWFSSKHRTSLFRHEGDVENNHTGTDEVVERLANHFKKL